jgi:hypothetical protein
MDEPGPVFCDACNMRAVPYERDDLTARRQGDLPHVWQLQLHVVVA